MKHSKAIIFLFALTLLLTACGNNSSNDSKSSPSYESKLKTLDELEKEAEEEAAQSTLISDGELYDSITGIYSDITLYDEVDSLGILINLQHESYDEDSAMFFKLLISICQSCEIEKYYSGVSFTLLVDNTYITTFFLGDYYSPTSFIITKPLMFTDNEYKEPLMNLYETNFAQNDADNLFDKKLKEIEEKYGLDN